MTSQVSQRTIKEFVNMVSDQHYAMAGAVIAASAAQAAALGEACMQISFDHQVDRLDWQDVTSRIEQLLHLKNTLLEWANQDAQSITDHHQAQTNQPSQALYEGPAEIASLAIAAVEMLEDFRPYVYVHQAGGLNMAIYLLQGAAQAALCLLNSNLNQWPDSSFSMEYQPIAHKLAAQLNQVALIA